MYYDVIRNIFEDDFFMANRRGSKKAPKTSYQRGDDADIFEMEVPGCSEKDVTVEAGRGFLAVEAVVRGQKVSRTYTVSERVDLDKVKADVTNGLLTIKIPKADEKNGIKKIL